MTMTRKILRRVVALTPDGEPKDPLDRGLFGVDAKTCRHFVELLDAPPLPNERLRRLLDTEAPWD